MQVSICGINDLPCGMDDLPCGINGAIGNVF